MLIYWLVASLSWSTVYCACQLELDIQSGNVSFAEALIGVHLNIAMSDDGLPWSTYDASTDTFTGGYSVDIVTALAERAGFSYTMTKYDLVGDETYTEALIRLTNTSDFIGTWYTDAADRRVLGMDFAHHFVDSTMVLVIALPHFEEATFSMTAFLKPFTTNLWIVIVCGIIFNAICGWLFHLMENESTQLKCSKCCRDKHCDATLLRDFGSYVYTSFGHFTAAGDGFEPSSIWSRISTLLWSFLVVIVLASYTANLASALIADSAVASTLETVDEIVIAGKHICTQEANIETAHLRSKWPNIKIMDATAFESGALMRNGSCVGSLMPYTEAIVMLQQDCDMLLTNTRMFPSGGSFVFQTDEDRCGPTYKKLVDYHFVRLEEAGSIEELWEEQLQLFECEYDAPEARDDTEGGIQMSLNDLGGLYLIYGIVVIVLLCVNAIVTLFVRKKTANEETAKDLIVEPQETA